MWGFLFYQSHQDKRKQGRKLKDGETTISSRNFDTKDCAALLRGVFLQILIH